MNILNVYPVVVNCGLGLKSKREYAGYVRKRPHCTVCATREREKDATPGSRLRQPVGRGDPVAHLKATSVVSLRFFPRPDYRVSGIARRGRGNNNRLIQVHWQCQQPSTQRTPFRGIAGVPRVQVHGTVSAIKKTLRGITTLEGGFSKLHKK